MIFFNAGGERVSGWRFLFDIVRVVSLAFGFVKIVLYIASLPVALLNTVAPVSDEAQFALAGALGIALLIYLHCIIPREWWRL